MRSKVSERILAKTPESMKMAVREYADKIVHLTCLAKENSLKKLENKPK